MVAKDAKLRVIARKNRWVQVTNLATSEKGWIYARHWDCRQGSILAGSHRLAGADLPNGAWMARQRPLEAGPQISAQKRQDLNPTHSQTHQPIRMHARF